MSEVVPFPLSRRRAYVHRQARCIGQLPPAAREKQLAHQLELQAAALTRRGIDAEVVAAQRRALESAIRAELSSYLERPA